MKVFRGYAKGELKDAFARVQNVDHWKNSISAVPGNLSLSDREIISAAIVFYAGCEPVFSTEGRSTRVVAVGYYAAVGA